MKPSDMFSDSHFVILSYYQRTVRWIRKIFASAVLLVIAFTVVIPACKKYDEGPGISLRSKKERIANQWNYQSVSTSDLLDRTSEFKDRIFTINDDYTYSFSGSEQIAYAGTWSFGNKKKSIILHNQAFEDDEWLILRLTEKEFWVIDQGEFGATAEYHFIPN